LGARKHEGVDASATVNEHRRNNKGQQEEYKEIKQQQDILVGHGSDLFFAGV
jgi:hypothetical protein